MLIAPDEESAKEAMRILERTAAGEEVARGNSPELVDEMRALRESMIQGAKQE